MQENSAINDKMKIVLFDIRKSGDNKDFNGGFGTNFQVRTSLGTRSLSLVRSKLETNPTMSYAYISSIFKKYGHSVEYLCNKLPKAGDLFLLHVSLIRHNEEMVLLKEMKERALKNIGVYGPLASVKPELFEDADFVIIGEPEEVIIKIAETNKIPKGRIKSDPIEDLDKLPFPDWSIFTIKSFSLAPAISLKPCVFIHASRGCPYGCSYCPYLVIGKYRVRKVEKVIEELKDLKNKYKIKAFYFRDPTFSINEERTRELAKLMIENKLNLRWGCETRLDLLTIDLLKLFYKAGLRAIKVGIESIDHNLLKEFNRTPPKILHQERVINFCKKIGIKVISFYIIGFPSDTKETIKKTIKYSQKLNTGFASFNICTPVAGTPFYEKMKDKIVDTNLNHYDNYHIVFKHDNLGSNEIMELQKKAITSYYFRPRYILRYIIDKIKEN